MNLTDLIPAPYRLLAGIALVGSLFGFTYYKGYSKGHALAKTEIAAFETKLSQSALVIERQQSKINELIAESTHAKIDTVLVRVAHNVPVIHVIPGPAVVVHDTTTRIELPLGWLSVHNASARGDNADSTFAANGAASGITPNDALGLIVQNYSVCESNAIRLNALQTWVKQAKVNVESTNKKL